MEMEAVDFEGLNKAMMVLEHQDMLVAMQIAAYPHLKKDAASRLHKDVYKKAFPNELKTGVKPLSAEQAELAMARFGNG